jgi:putative copper export protein
VLFALGLYFRERQPEAVRAFWIANLWLMALVIGTLSVGSHATGSRVLPWVAIGIEWAHASAVGFWAGGLAALVLVLPAALAPYAAEDRRRALAAALNRFSRVAVISVAVVITSGIYLASNWFYTPGDVATTYGEALALKLVLVAGLLLVGLAHHMALRPERYARWSPIWGRARGFISTLRLETVIALAVLASVGLLSATPPPVPDFAANAPPAPTASQTVGDLTVSATISPGGPGVNSYDLVVTRGGKPVDGQNAQTRISSPSADWRGGWHDAQSAGDGLYVATGDDISAAGAWWMLVDVGSTRFAFDWNITDAAAVTQTIPPNFFQILALIAVAAALIFAVWTRLSAWYHHLDLRPAFVATAIGATVGSAVLIGAGFVIMNQSLDEFQATTNPPPTIVNAELPDSASLDRGKTLLAADCPVWLSSDNRDQVEFARRLTRMRDEDLFNATAKGWRSLPSCSFTDAQRWDAVNYLRSLEPITNETETG